MADERIVKIPLPLPLIRDMDNLLVAGVGGYESRAHLIKDAIDSFLLELRYPEAPQEPTVNPTGQHAQVPARVPQAPAVTADDWSATVLGGPPPDAKTMEDGEVVVSEAPMFGLHNRDYPSLWLASQLAEASKSGPVKMEAFLNAATDAAWKLAARFATATSNGIKAAALFPANADKRQSSEQGFRAFAFGTVTTSKTGQLTATGPLFQWQVCQAKAASRGVAIGVTPAGADLLRSLAGISMRVPHEQVFAERFLSFLSTNAPADWKAFVQLLRLLEERPNRSQLIPAFHRHYPNWTPVQAATNAAGYVARGREWGLVETKLSNGCYELTAYGADFLRKAEQ